MAVDFIGLLRKQQMIMSDTEGAKHNVNKQ